MTIRGLQAEVLRSGGVFIDGEMLPVGVRPMLTIVDPTTEQVFGEAAAGGAAEIDRAVLAARAAMLRPSWSALSRDDRCAIVLRLADLLDVHREELATLTAQEMGWPIASGRRLGESVELCRAYVAAIRELDLEYVRRGGAGSDALVIRRPVGVVGGILPWNAPLRSAVKKAVPALLAGCAVVLKPAPETPFDALRLAELAIEAGLPAGILNVVTGGTDAGEALVRHPEVRKIAFTGSTSTGRRIAAIGGDRLARLQLELGGKSAALFLADADVETSSRTLTRQTFRASGQTCTALTRALVPRAQYRDYVDALVAASHQEVVGDPLDDSTTMGPLISDRQRSRVAGYLDLAREAGATVAVGDVPTGDRGFFLGATVLSDIDPAAAPAREEIFGPVLTVIPYDDEDDAVRIVNDSEYGLHGGIFSADDDRALRLARLFDTGTVALGARPIPIEAPFGGVKASGLGREHGPEGYEHFLEFQSIVVDRAHADRLIESGVPLR
jgi:acyl-CoA reductase-like NAD-dependent aldehyde dehydrogenase